MSQSPVERTGSAAGGRHWLWAVAVLAVLALLWVAPALVGRGAVPGSRTLTTRLFAVALAMSYVGLWITVVLLSTEPRLMGLRALASTLTLLGMLAVLELPAAMGIVHWTRVMRSLGRERVDYVTAYLPDAELGWRRPPGLTWEARHASDIEGAYGLPPSATEPLRFTFDRQGYRNVADREQAEVVLLGDSYVEGWYVSDEQTVAAALERLLGRPIASLGVAGYGTLQALRVLKGDGLARRPRVAAWFFFEGNDLYDDEAFESTLVSVSAATAAPPGRPGFSLQGWHERSFVTNAFRRLRRWSHPLVPNRAPHEARLAGTGERVLFFPYAAVPWTGYETERWATARAALEEGLAFARERELHLAFVYVPIKFRVFRGLVEIPLGSPMASWSVWTELPRLFAEFCAATGATCLDLTTPFRQAAERGILPYPPADSHWSPEGHAIAAAELARVIDREGWLAPATPPGAPPAP